MRFASVSLILFLAACGDSGSSDAGLDATAHDDSNVDTGVDAGDVDLGAADMGPSIPELCGPCRRDTDCGDGNLCLALLNGERACGRPCGGDGDCSADYQCIERIAGEPLQCSPRARTCVISPAGGTCAGAGDCAGRYSLCRDPLGTGNVCTTACANDADCTIGLSRCRDTGGERICVPDALPSGERCALLLAHGHATACGAGDACASGTRCVGTGATKICAAPPTGSGATCPTGTARFTPADGAGDVCIPVATDPDDWSELGGDCACAGSVAPASLYGRALAAVGRDECEQGFADDILRLFGDDVAHDPFRFSFTDRIRGHWPAAVHFADETASALDTTDPAVVLAVAARDADLRLSPPRSASTAATVDALAALVTATGGTADTAALGAQLATLDAGLAAALADVFAALADALTARETALARIPVDDRAPLYDAPMGTYLAGVGTVLDPHLTTFQGALRGDVDVARMASAARDLLDAIRRADLARFAGTSGALAVTTPAGRITVGGASAQTYDDGTYHDTLFLLDLGGDDTYRFPAGATTDATHGLSVVVDVAGSDTYAYDEHVVADDTTPTMTDGARLPSDGAGRGITMIPGSPPRDLPASRSSVSRQGAGRLGIGLLVDLGATTDHYRSLRMSQGFGALGVGVLYDAHGDDTYDGEAAVQGHAVAGLGIVLDAEGADHYTAYALSQAYADVRGVAILDDQAGDDVYLAVTNDVLYYSPQDPGGSNSSMSQGAAHGTPPGSDPAMSGGLAVLRDRSGADRYTGAIFAQGTGYGFGTGMLLDGGGADTYDAQWYVQGAAAHYAVGISIDDGPDRDVHNMTARRQNMTLGAGHDFSLGVFLDRGGDDEYHAPNLAIGGANAAGTGIFGDVTGNDTYECTSDLSFGNTSVEMPGDGAREAGGTLGFFLDAAGTDTYTRPSVTVTPANDTMWTQDIHGPGHGEHGAGVDDHGMPLGI